MANAAQYTTGCAITPNVPYKIIDINHDGTTNTVDLQSMVAANYIVWSSAYNSWTYGRYSTSGIYNWLPNTCATGYSANIQSKMCNMTERWREATGNYTGELQTRQTKCKLLNPYEIFGSSSTTFTTDWGGTVSDFDSSYGQHYSDIFPNSIAADNSRLRYHAIDMTTPSYWCPNSYYAWNSPSSSAQLFRVNTDGSCDFNSVIGCGAVVPVIRLSANPT